MKIHFIIEFETDAAGVPIAMKARKVQPVAQVPPGAVVHLADGQTVTMPGKRRGRPPKHQPLPIPPEPTPELPKVTSENNGHQFDPAFLKIIQEAPEPFTRRSVAISTGLDVAAVTVRFNRLKHRGWIINPAPQLWKRTATFGI